MNALPTPRSARFNGSTTGVAGTAGRGARDDHFVKKVISTKDAGERVVLINTASRDMWAEATQRREVRSRPAWHSRRSDLQLFSLPFTVLFQPFSLPFHCQGTVKGSENEWKGTVKGSEKGWKSTVKDRLTRLTYVGRVVHRTTRRWPWRLESRRRSRWQRRRRRRPKRG